VCCVVHRWIDMPAVDSAGHVPSNALLPTPASPRRTVTRLVPAITSVRSWLSASHSVRRPRSVVPPVPAAPANADLPVSHRHPTPAPRQSHSFGTRVSKATLPNRQAPWVESPFGQRPPNEPSAKKSLLLGPRSTPVPILDSRACLGAPEQPALLREGCPKLPARADVELSEHLA
jgi:hypothetical protein